jgi:hypothetical protein
MNTEKSHLHLPIVIFLGILTLAFNVRAASSTLLISQASAIAPLGPPEPVATVFRLEGQGWVVHRDESREKLAVGQAILNGDSIETGANAVAQLRFTDNSLVSLRSSSQIAIQDYNWRPATRSGNAALELIKGAFRAVTGLIGDNDPDSYTFDTPVALIGIRGTDFGARYCAEATCSIDHEGDSLTLSRGVYIGVVSGSVVARSPAANRVVNTGEAIYQKDAQTAPQSIQNLPGIIFNATELASKQRATKVKLPDYSAFITGSDNMVLRDSLGNCLRSSAYRADHGVTECQ